MKQTYVRTVGCLAALLIGITTAGAGDVTWTGGGSDAYWTNNANWNPGAPSPDDVLIFDGSTQTNPDNNYATNTGFGGMAFASGASMFTLGGNAINLAGVVRNDSVNLQTIGLPMALTNTTTFDAAAGDLSVTAAVSGTGPLIKTGAGTLTLASTSYSGGTTVSNGLLVVKNGNGNYTMSGGSLMLDFKTYSTGFNVPFTTNATVGVNPADNGEPNGIDFYSGTIGSTGFTWTKNGVGMLRMFGGAVGASAIDIAEGTLDAWGDSTSPKLTPFGGATVPINVAYGATLMLDANSVCPNPITLNGGTGAPGQNNNRGSITAGNRNGPSVNINSVTNTVTLAADSMVGVPVGSLVMSGNITGPGGLTKTGSGPLVLSGLNNYGGDTTVSAGTLRLGSSTAIPGGATNGNLNLNGDSSLDLNGFSATINGLLSDGSGTPAIGNSSTNPSTLTLGGNDSYITWTGPVGNAGGGALSLAKIGSGIASFLGANTHSGSNVVSGGTLEINIPSGTTTGGLVAVADTATLSLHKTTSASSLKASGLSLGGGSTTLTIDLGNFGNPSSPIIAATNGAGVLAANGTVTITFNNTANLSIGSFSIIKYNSRTGSGDFVLTPIGGGITAQIVTNGNSIDLQITYAPITTWKGTIDNVWDRTTTNWTLAGSPTLYSDYGSILFDDTALTNDVNATDVFYPGSMLVNTTNTYVFSGAGSLGSGSGTLTKNGSGTMILATSGNNPGGITIAAGTLQVGANGATGDLGSANIQDDGTLSFMRSDPITLANTITGSGVVAQNNTNTLTINNAANTYSGGTVVNQGTLKISLSENPANTALGTPGVGVTFVTVTNGATLDFNGQYFTATNMTVVSGSGFNGAGALNSSGGYMNLGYQNIGLNNVVLAGDTVFGSSGSSWQIGKQGLGLSGNNRLLTKIGGNSIYLWKNAASSPSQVIIGGGVFQFCENTNALGSASITLTNGGGLDTWNNETWQAYSTGTPGLTIHNNMTVGNGGGRLVNDSAAYNGSHANYDTYRGSILLNDNLTFVNTAQRGGGIGKITVSGPISGSGGIICNQATNLGGNVTVLTGAATYTGLTIVNSGTLQLSTVQQGGGVYTNMDGATLDVASQSGYTTMPMSVLALGSTNGSILRLARVAILTTNVPITATNLVLTGTNLVMLAPGAFLTPGQYPLIHFGSNSGTGSIGMAGRGVPATVVTNNANSTIDVVVIPGGSPVTWTGSAGNLWDIDSSLNWLYEAASTTYKQASVPGDAVTFNDSGTVTNVSISATVSPSLVVVSNEATTYTFTGSAIAGPGGLLKRGAGTLFLTNGANTFTGGAVITGGTVKLGNNGSLNDGSGSQVIVQGAGTVDLNGYSPQNTTFTISGAGAGGQGAIVANANGNYDKCPGAVTLAGDATIGGATRWDLRNGVNRLNSPTNAYTLTKVGPNLISLVNTVVSTNLGDVYVRAGTLGYQLNTTGLGDPSKSLVLASGAAINFYEAAVPLNKQIVCSNDSTIIVQSGGGGSGVTPTTKNIITGPIQSASAGGKMKIACDYYNGCAISNSITGPGGVNFDYNAYIRLYAPNTYQGDTDILGGTYLHGNACISNAGTVYVNVGPLYITNNAYVKCNYLNANAGSLIIGGSGSIAFSTLRVGGLTLDVTGRTDGTLTLTSGEAVRIDNGAVIKGNVVAGSGSSIAPGGGGYVQTTGTNIGNVTFEAGSTNFMDVNKTATATNCDVVNVTGLLTYGGTLRLQTNGTVPLVVGDSFKLFSFGSYSGNFSIVDPSGTTWSFNPTNGVATVTGLPSAVNQDPTNLVASASGGFLTLRWPEDHKGWRLEGQTNGLSIGLSNNWSNVDGAELTNLVVVPIASTNGAVFYRMVYP